MKKLLAFLLFLLWPTFCARGETWRVETAMGPAIEVTRFEQELPQALQVAYDASPFAGDPVLQGVMISQLGEAAGQAEALIAVEHQGATLLLGGQADMERPWSLWPAAEDFLPETWRIDAYTRRNSKGEISQVMLAVLSGQDYYLMRNYANDGTHLLYYGRQTEAGAFEVDVDYTTGGFCAVDRIDGARTNQEVFDVCLPDMLEYLRADDLPKDRAGLEALAEAHPFSLDGIWARAANLRDQPTSKAKSLGKYRVAKATLLDTVQGTNYPWYQLQIGDTIGWMSGTYVDFVGGSSFRDVQATPLDIALTKADTTLCASPYGASKQDLPAATAMYILADCDGWYHVCLAQGDLTWHEDPSSTYGYVAIKDVEEYWSPLAMKYGVPIH